MLTSVLAGSGHLFPPPFRCPPVPDSPRRGPRAPQRPRQRLRLQTPGSGAPRRRLRDRSRRVSRAPRWRGQRGRTCPRSAPAAPPAATAVWAPRLLVPAWRLRVAAPGVRVRGSTAEGRAGEDKVDSGGSLGTVQMPLRKDRVQAWAGGGTRSTAACMGRRRALPCAGTGAQSSCSPVTVPWRPRTPCGWRNAEGRG